MLSSIEMSMRTPSPVRARWISAPRIELYAYMPAAMSAIEQLAQDRDTFRMLDVDGQALLRAIRPHEVRRHAAHALVVAARDVAAARALDLDHARAEVGELARAEGRRDDVLEREDEDAVERAHRIGQNERGRPRTCSAMYASTRLVEIGATW